jgi:8-oxo-dGTP diphosphatase
MGDRLKIVQYWSAQVGEGSFTPNREVDELWWAPPAEAVGLLSYDRDVHLLDAMTAAQVDTVPVVVMRHCASMSRSAHHGPGEERTLSDAGFVHAAVLAEILACYGKLRVVCSPARRCVDSVIPYAQANGLPVHMDPGLAEAAVGSQDPARVLRGALARNRPALLCTHRPVLPELFPGFAVPDRTADELLLPGEFMVLHTSAGKVVAMDRHTPY